MLGRLLVYCIHRLLVDIFVVGRFLVWDTYHHPFVFRFLSRSQTARRPVERKSSCNYRRKTYLLNLRLRSLSAYVFIWYPRFEAYLLDWPAGGLGPDTK
jgi:hypothetical protein